MKQPKTNKTAPVKKKIEKLTDKQEMFCREYIIDLNASQAAIRAGYSKATAKEQASRLLTNVNISNRVMELKSNRSIDTGITANRVLEEYAKIAFFDIRESFDVDGGLIHIKQLDDKSAGAISSIKSSEEWAEDGSGNKVIIGTLKEIKVFDKIRALQDLGKHLGLFEKDNDQSKPVVSNIINLGDGEKPE